MAREGRWISLFNARFSLLRSVCSVVGQGGLRIDLDFRAPQPHEQASRACPHSRSYVCGNPGRLLSEGLAAFIPWGCRNVLGRRALLLALAAAAAVFGDSVEGNTARCFHVLSAERQPAAAGNAVSYGCEAVPCSWLLSSHRITGLGFCKVPFTALWSTEGTR